MNLLALPTLPEGYYWKYVRRNKTARNWSDWLIIYRKRRCWFDYSGRGFQFDTGYGEKMPVDEILAGAAEAAQRQFYGPLTPITGYEFEGVEY